jgi:hypothetical protein
LQALAAAAPSNQQRGRGGEERASSDGMKGRRAFLKKN